MTALITDRRTDDLVWRRTLSVSQPASPQIFGLGQIIGNMVTATTLSNMTTEELASGFRRARPPDRRSGCAAAGTRPRRARARATRTRSGPMRAETGGPGAARVTGPQALRERRGPGRRHRARAPRGWR